MIDNSVYVVNNRGIKINFGYAVSSMDDGIRKQLNAELAPCTEQQFFTAYSAAHEKKYGTEWFLDTGHPKFRE